MLDAGSLQLVPRRHPGRWVLGAIVIFLCALLGRSVATNPNFQWGVVGHYFLSRSILLGLGRTVELTAISMAIGIALGLILSIMRQSRNPVLATVSWLYIWFFRGTPLLVQIIFWFNLSALYPRLGVGVPFGPTLYEANANALITTFTAAILALGLNEGAYMAEIVRSGLLAVDEGQLDAAAALGMRRGTTLRRVVLPQAMKVIIPPTGNQAIAMLKLSSLVSVIALPELLYSVQVIYARTFQTIPLLIVASLWYLIVTSVLTIGQYYLERYAGRGGPGGAPGPRFGEARAVLRQLGRPSTTREVG